MVNPVHYRFDAVWRIRADPGDVWDVLYDVPSFPDWWPEVKRVSDLTGENYEVLARSALPYDLVFTLGQNVADRDSGVLEAELRGDLEGFSRWTIRPARAGTVMFYVQEVVTTKGLFNVLAPIARPAFRLNHHWMMRNGERGLRTFMAGHRFGRSGPLGEHQEKAEKYGRLGPRAVSR